MITMTMANTIKKYDEKIDNLKVDYWAALDLHNPSFGDAEINKKSGKSTLWDDDGDKIATGKISDPGDFF